MELNENISTDSIFELMDIDEIFNTQNMKMIDSCDKNSFLNYNKMYLLVEIIKLKSENNQLEKKSKMIENLLKSQRSLFSEKFNVDDFVCYINNKRNFLTSLGVNSEINNINIISLENKKKERKKKNKKI